jgi:hypothetical protein
MQIWHHCCLKHTPQGLTIFYLSADGSVNAEQVHQDPNRKEETYYFTFFSTIAKLSSDGWEMVSTNRVDGLYENVYFKRPAYETE